MPSAFQLTERLIQLGFLAIGQGKAQGCRGEGTFVCSTLLPETCVLPSLASPNRETPPPPAPVPSKYPHTAQAVKIGLVALESRVLHQDTN